MVKEIKKQSTYCITRSAGHQGVRHPVRNQAGVVKLTTGSVNKKSCYRICNAWSPASVPASRDNKPGWYKLHNKYTKVAFSTSCDTLVIGDSIVSGLLRYKDVWTKFFADAINLGIGGDMTQHVLWRIRNTRMSQNINFVVVHCGTNNVDSHRPDDIANALVLIGEKIQIYNPDIKVIISGILPRGSNLIRSEKITKINSILKKKCDSIKKNIFYLEHDSDWTNDDGSLRDDLFYADNLHLVRPGNVKLSREIDRTIKT